MDYRQAQLRLFTDMNQVGFNQVVGGYQQDFVFTLDAFRSRVGMDFQNLVLAVDGALFIDSIQVQVERCR